MSTKVSVPSRVEIERYLALEAERLELDRKSRAVASEAALIADELKAYVAAVGRDVVRCGYTLAIAEGPKYPKWREEFVAALGKEAAAIVVESTPASEVFRVTKAAMSAGRARKMLAK